MARERARRRPASGCFAGESRIDRDQRREIAPWANRKPRSHTRNVFRENPLDDMADRDRTVAWSGTGSRRRSPQMCRRRWRRPWSPFGYVFSGVAERTLRHGGSDTDRQFRSVPTVRQRSGRVSERKSQSCWRIGSARLAGQRKCVHSGQATAGGQRARGHACGRWRRFGRRTRREVGRRSCKAQEPKVENDRHRGDQHGGYRWNEVGSSSSRGIRTDRPVRRVG